MAYYRIKVFDENSKEYAKLGVAASLMTYVDHDHKRRKFTVDVSNFDYEGYVLWTTILGTTGLETCPQYQALTEEEQARILAATSVEDMLRIVKAIFAKERDKERRLGW